MKKEDCDTRIYATGMRNNYVGIKKCVNTCKQ